jgi:hypothetical protein
MPGFDATGPLGQGSGTGRGLGPCKENDLNEYYGPSFWGRFTRSSKKLGRGLRRGRGRLNINRPFNRNRGNR